MLATALLVLMAAASGSHHRDYRQLKLSATDVKNVSAICHQRYLGRVALEKCLKTQTEALEKAKQGEIDARDAEARTLREMDK